MNNDKNGIGGPPASVEDSLTFSESMKWCRHYFHAAVEALSKSPQEICKEYGDHSAVAWELRQDVLSGKPLVEWEGVSEVERVDIKALFLALEMMPERSFSGRSSSELNDPAWIALRKMATEFLRLHGQVRED